MSRISDEKLDAIQDEAQMHIQRDWQSVEVVATDLNSILLELQSWRALEANQRTPGTLEVCERWRSNHCSDHPQSDFDVSLCHTPNCPRKVALSQQKEAT